MLRQADILTICSFFACAIADESKNVDYFELLSMERTFVVDLRQMEKNFWKVGSG